MTLFINIIIGLIIFEAVEGKTNFEKVCYEASRCTHRRHTRRNERCAINTDGLFKRFREECEMTQYNCKHHQEYILTNLEDCNHLPKLKKCPKCNRAKNTSKIVNFLAKLHVSLESEPDPQKESKAEPNQESMREWKPKSEAQSNKELKLKSKTESTPGPLLESEPKSNSESAAESELEVKTESVPESHVLQEPKPKPTILVKRRYEYNGKSYSMED